MRGATPARASATPLILLLIWFLPPPHLATLSPALFSNLRVLLSHYGGGLAHAFFGADEVSLG